MVEIEFSILSEQCLDDRIPDEDTLRREVTAWENTRNENRATVVRLLDRAGGVNFAGGSLRDRLCRAFDLHPSGRLRASVLEQPEKAFGRPVWIGLTAGLLVAFIDLSLTGSYTVMQWVRLPGLTAVVIGFLAVSLWLTPRAVVSGYTGRQWAGSVARVIGMILFVRTGADLLNLLVLWMLVLFAPGHAQEILTQWISNSVRVFVPPTDLFGGAELILFALRATAAVGQLALLILVGITLGGLADFWLKRLTLTWYGLLRPEKTLPRLWWGITMGIALALGGVFLPLVDWPFGLLLGVRNWNWLVILGPVGIGLLLTAGLAAFWVTHRQQGRRCARQHPVPGWFVLGDTCSQCGDDRPLHPWLIAGY